MAELADQRYVENNELKAELAKLQKKYDNDMSDWEHRHMLEMEMQKDNYERKLDQIKKMLLAEIGVLEHIVDEQQKNVIASLIIYDDSMHFRKI